MPDVAAIREQIDRRIRPGQVDTATVSARAPGDHVLGSTRTTAANRYDWAETENYRYALYGRSRYGVGRYLAVA